MQLEITTPDQLKAEDRQNQARAAMRKKLNRRLTGTAGDLTATLPGMHGFSNVPLFTEVK